MWNIIENLFGDAIEQAEEIVSEYIEGQTKKEAKVFNYTSENTAKVMAILFNVPGMNQAYSRDFLKSNPIFSLKDGTIVKISQSPAIARIFLVDSEGKLIVGYFISRTQAKALNEALNKIKTEFT
ncbi:MAG: hypothetical protein KME01_03490 [Chroococcus sp. CMT-3BRIN-NPC107]|jgi:hypothetical protein|nr:hypothetical protein [Chroococcus sp. CMT-3BRIN-NPC107]